MKPPSTNPIFEGFKANEAIPLRLLFLAPAGRVKLYEFFSSVEEFNGKVNPWLRMEIPHGHGRSFWVERMNDGKTFSYCDRFDSWEVIQFAEEPIKLKAVDVRVSVPPSMMPQLTSDERKILQHTVEAWNSFIQLPNLRDDDTADFRKSINQLQRIIATRLARRLEPSVFGK